MIIKTENLEYEIPTGADVYFASKKLGQNFQMFNLVMLGNYNVNDLDECRLEEKNILNGYHSVQFYLNGNCYLFRLRNKSSNQPYILVKKDSSVFNELKVGDILNMEYNHFQSLGAGKLLKTLIASKRSHDHYKGHSIVELSIIDH